MKRFQRDYGLNEEQAELICDEKAQADYFEEALSWAIRGGLEVRDGAARIRNWVLSDIKHVLNRDGLAVPDIAALKLCPRRLASLVVLAAQGRVSSKNAKQTLEAVLAEDKDPETIIRERNWEQLRDPEKIAEAARAVLAGEQSAVEEIRAARAGGSQKRADTLTAYLLGKVLERTGGRADPRIAGALIAELIGPG